MKKKCAVSLCIAFLLCFNLFSSNVVSAHQQNHVSTKGIRPTLVAQNNDEDFIKSMSDQGYYFMKFDYADSANFTSDKSINIILGNNNLSNNNEKLKIVNFSIDNKNYYIKFQYDYDENKSEITWESSNLNMFYVDVKASNQYNQYDYTNTTGFSSDSQLCTPSKDDGKHYGLSHVTFIFKPLCVEIQGSIRVNKAYDNVPEGVNPPEVEFILLNGEGTEVARKTTTNKTVIFDKLAIGNYKIKETAVVGYELKTDLSNIIDLELNKDAVVNVVNSYIPPVEIKGSITVNKTYENVPEGVNPPEVEFILLKADGTEVARKTTTNKTVMFENLPIGNYKIKETVIAGYELKTDLSNVIDLELNKDAVVNVVNSYVPPVEIKGSITVNKTYENVPEGVNPPEVEFILLKADGTEAARKTTTNKTVKFENLPIGNYKIKETTVAGYELKTDLSNVIDLELNKDAVVNVVNKKIIITPVQPVIPKTGSHLDMNILVLISAAFIAMGCLSLKKQKC